MTKNWFTPPFRRYFLKALNTALGRNISSLYLLQFTNYLLPIITIPYLVRVLGPKNFGAVAFAQSLTAYFLLLVNYGFEWSATRKISVHRHNAGKVSQIASSVWCSKLLLAILGLILLYCLVETMPRFMEVRYLLLILYGTVLGNALFPAWLFQGMEKMVLFSMINFVAQVLTTVGIFSLIQHPSDSYIYAWLLSFKWMLAGVLGIVLAKKILKISFLIPVWSEIIETLREGWILFLSRGVVSLYTSSNALILGLLTNHVLVGYYSAAEKLVRAVQELLSPIAQAVYPRFTRMAAQSSNVVLYWAKKALIVQASIGIVLSGLLMFSSETIVKMVLGDQYMASIPILKILALLPMLAGVSITFGRFIMLPLGKDKPRLVILFFTGIINISCALLFIPLMQAKGMAVAVLIAEFFVAAAYFVYLVKNGLNPIRPSSACLEDEQIRPEG